VLVADVEDPASGALILDVLLGREWLLWWCYVVVQPAGLEVGVVFLELRGSGHEAHLLDLKDAKLEHAWNLARPQGLVKLSRKDR
jgi:hypothetical protein